LLFDFQNPIQPKSSQVLLPLSKCPDFISGKSTYNMIAKLQRISLRSQSNQTHLNCLTEVV
jgi:hypothetical protein